MSSSEIEDIGLVEKGKDDAEFTSEHAEFEVLVEQYYTRYMNLKKRAESLAHG